MTCPDCLVAMVIHHHEEWPKMTYHCFGCTMVMYRNEKKEEVILEDPTEDLISQDLVPIEQFGPNTPHQAHRLRVK